jgi:hypothetical protein
MPARYLGVPYSRMDCQAFAEQCLRDCGLEINLAGSNAWFREVYRNGVILTPEECVKRYGSVPPGAFLFILKRDGGEPEKYRADGLGNASHIGIATGKGEGAIHSSASRGYVAESRFAGKTILNGGWNRVGLWNRVDYGVDIMPAVSEPGDDPAVPEPAATAVVWAENGKPVNTRKGPGKHYGLSKAGKLPVGTAAEILSRKGSWDQIRYTDRNGASWVCWMMDAYLRPADDVPAEPGTALYTVSVPNLTEAQAEELLRKYPGAEKHEQKG